MRSRHRQILDRLNIGNDDIESDLTLLFADLAPEYIAAIEKEHIELRRANAVKTSQKESKKLL